VPTVTSKFDLVGSKITNSGNLMTFGLTKVV